MNFRNISFTVILMLLFFAACEEIGPDIQLEDPEVNEALLDTTYTIANLPAAQEKKVLVEDFTGVRCVNCPNGHAQIDLLKNTYPGRVIAVALHSNFLADPYGSEQDLRTDDAQSLDQRLGPTIAKPTGAVDRIEVGGETLLFINQWAQACGDRINQSVPVNIEITNESDASEKVLVKVKMIFLEEITEALSVSVFLLESDIEVTQLTPDGEDEAYIHDHVLRKALTPFSGLGLSAQTFESGLVIEKEFELEDFESAWNPEHFEVVAFVHQSSGELNVYQSAEIEL